MVDTKAETWSKSFPSLKYGSWFWLRDSPADMPRLTRFCGGYNFYEPLGIVNPATEYLGPVLASDSEELMRLREIATGARDVLALLVPYGKIHTVEGVKYPDGSHSEAVDRGEQVLNALRHALGTQEGGK